MRRAGRLIAVALAGACATAAVGAAPAAAGVNDLVPTRAAVVTAPITVQALAPPACDGMALTTLVTAATHLRGAKIQGTDGADLVLGTAGDDRLDAKQGDDCLVGGGGADQLDGGPGSDVCVAGDPGDTVVRCEA